MASNRLANESRERVRQVRTQIDSIGHENLCKIKKMYNFLET